jgi:hypothetical protein
MNQFDNYEQMHKHLGCPGCGYCNEAKLYIDACCSRTKCPEYDQKTGKCLSRITREERRGRRLYQEREEEQ